MPAFPFTLHDQNYDFLPKSYYLVYPVADENAIGRQTFTTMSELEKERETREHRESGSKYPWQGGNVEKPSPVTFTRGLGIKDNQFDNGLEVWYDSGVKLDMYIDVFNDNSEDLSSNVPRLRFQLYKSRPQKYKSFGGDAKSSDTCMEELTVVMSKWSRIGAVDIASGVTPPTTATNQVASAPTP